MPPNLIFHKAYALTFYCFCYYYCWFIFTLFCFFYCVLYLLKRLCALGAPIAVLTGVSLEKGRYGVMAYDSKRDEYCEYYSEHLPYSFHGTGDVFSSACFAALMHGKNLSEALKVAVEFTTTSIRDTVSEENPIWYGVNFEYAIPKLLEMLK